MGGSVSGCIHGLVGQVGVGTVFSPPIYRPRAGIVRHTNTVVWYINVTPLYSSVVPVLVRPWQCAHGIISTCKRVLPQSISKYNKV